MERLGLGPEPLLETNRKLVYGRVTGWGQQGPLSAEAGHDINYLAVTGLLHGIGPKERPVVPINYIADFAGGGMMLAFGMLAALLAVRSGGDGQIVDAAMSDGAALIGALTYGMRAAGLWRDDREANLLDGGAANYGIDATAVVGDTRLGLDIVVAGKHPTVRVYGRDRPAPDLPASTPLVFVVDGQGGRPGEWTWQDDETGKLEAKIAQVTAGIIAAGEARFRRGLKEAEEREEQYRRWQEQRRREQVEARNRERLKHLRESADLLRQAEDLRALVSRVRDAVVAGAVGVDQARLAAWEQWASAEADRLDPVLSGQVMSHLATPIEDD